MKLKMGFLYLSTIQRKARGSPASTLTTTRMSSELDGTGLLGLSDSDTIGTRGKIPGPKIFFGGANPREGKTKRRLELPPGAFELVAGSGFEPETFGL